MNPGDVADILETDTTKFELIQLTPPVGETLAVYEQNTREFLYPGRKLTPSYPGMDRELLMKRSVDFPVKPDKIENILTADYNVGLFSNHSMNQPLLSTPDQRLYELSIRTR
ncbi:hypothetical protein chiPu_0017298 [Chiloscyllium punctatum]|uniref:Spermatogenesis-associated protein 6 N-terminal domain-containing protein n=1 Tax=Chiloscyllium punctatum TaxID=137246 RepID=A0A401RET3_CHIPU|nr:hypothetical protein [Chiloscyllium punctatum]